MAREPVPHRFPASGAKDLSWAAVLGQGLGVTCTNCRPVQLAIKRALFPDEFLSGQSNEIGASGQRGVWQCRAAVTEEL